MGFEVWPHMAPDPDRLLLESEDVSSLDEARDPEVTLEVGDTLDIRTTLEVRG